MQIQLKQTEIVAALKQFISNQGISLVDKSVDIKFTAGRKDTGLSADIVIEDISGEIPGFTDTKASDETTAGVKPTLTVVKTDTPETGPEPTVGEPPAAVPEPDAKPPSNSLFG